MTKLLSFVRSLFVAFCLLSTSVWAGEPTPININSADAESIAQALNGVGSVRAKAIVDWRKNHGAFQSVDQLLEIKGIGEALLAKNRDLIRLD